MVGLVALAMAGADKKRSCLLAGAVATGQPQRINKPSECGLHSRALDEMHAPVSGRVPCMAPPALPSPLGTD